MAKYTLKELKDKYYNVGSDYLIKQSLYFETQKELYTLERAFFIDCRYCENYKPWVYDDDDDYDDYDDDYDDYDDNNDDDIGECVECVFMNGFKPTKEWLLKTKNLLADNKKED